MARYLFVVFCLERPRSNVGTPVNWVVGERLSRPAPRIPLRSVWARPPRTKFQAGIA
jgi:hypothetical protein